MMYFGIDVSKNKLDCAWLRDVTTTKVRTRGFPNNPKGFKTILDWAQDHTGLPVDQLHFTMEATGVYHEAAAYALHQGGATVAVVNPAHIHRYAQSHGRRSKTDRKDSVVLARYGALENPRPWQPEPPEVRSLRALIARLAAVEKDLQREANRKEKAQISQASAEVVHSIEIMLEHLREERHRLLQQIDTHIDQHPHLKADRQLLETIPAIGEVLSREILALLRSRSFLRASQPAAYIGIVPLHHHSGTSVHKPAVISKTGPSRLRAKLYMGAVVAISHNPTVKQHYQRLLKAGKPKSVALVGAMRKLLHICFGVLKHQTPFQVQPSMNTVVPG